MSININSEASCRKAYLNYHCYGNSMNISAAEMGEIAKRWESKLNSWQATVSNDENQYEFDDTEFLTSKENGKKLAQDNTSFDGKADNTGSKLATSANWVGGIGAAAAGITASVLMACKSATSGLCKACIWVGLAAAGLLQASAIALKAAQPNKEAANACEQMSNSELPNAQAALEATQADMENMANELVVLSEQANEANEDANNDIEEQKTEYDMYRASYEALKAKAESGEPLSEDEKALYQELVKYMTETGEGITETQENTTDLVGEIYDDMGTYQEGYDYAAETMAEVEGVTEFAESFDYDTKHNAGLISESCTMGMIGAGAIGAAGLTGLTKALAKMSNPFTAALGLAEKIAAGVTIGMGVASGIMFKGIQNDQNKYRELAETEIDIRKDTQSFNSETMDMYTEEIDAYDGHMTGVEDLELEIPDDVEPPEDTALPATPVSGLPEGTPDPIKPDKKEDEEK